jgi:hypothetical protein
VGRHGIAADDRHRRLRGVPTWTEFELLRDAFLHEGIPRPSAIPGI